MSGPASLATQAAFFPQPPSAFGFAPASAQSQLANPDGSPPTPFSGQQTPISPPFNQTNPNPISAIASTIPQGQTAQLPQSLGGPLFDHNDPALFNFDVSSLNFGNHYGALEFGMLGHMSSGAAGTPPPEGIMDPLGQPSGMYHAPLSGPPMPSSFPESAAMTASLTYVPDGLAAHSWPSSHSRQGSTTQMHTPSHTPVAAIMEGHGRRDSIGGVHAYAVGQDPSSHSSASPTSSCTTYDTDNPMLTTNLFAGSSNVAQPLHRDQHRNSHPTALQPIHSNTAMHKRRRDTSFIYEGITKPHPYALAFHRLSVLIQQRFPKEKSDKIAKAMSKFRPILIASATDLDKNDLIHNEKNLQRQLLIIEDMIAETGTPILVCRRTGEVVLVGKEFTMLTGWRRKVLLGKEPNLNVNTATDQPSTGVENAPCTSRAPIPGSRQEADSGPTPVSIAELMDEDSVVQFYEDYSQLAYQNSRGTKMRRIKLLKYRTTEDLSRFDEMRSAFKKHEAQDKSSADSGTHTDGAGSAGALSQGDGGVSNPGARERMVDCMIGWHIKRDNFDMPMLIVMTVSICFCPSALSHAVVESPSLTIGLSGRFFQS